jgi:hypothetical protein
MFFNLTHHFGSLSRLIGTSKEERKTRGVSHYGLAIYIKKYLKAKEEELWKFKYFTMKKYNIKKNPLKEIKILQDIITL